MTEAVFDPLARARGCVIRERENVRRARRAWDGSIRHSMLKVANVGSEPDRVKSGGLAPLIRIKGSLGSPEIQSGIMLGKPFDELTFNEQFRVVSAWIAESGEAI